MSGFEAESWAGVLAGTNDTALQLFLARIESGDYRPPSEPFSSCLMDHVLSALDGNVDISAFKGRWYSLFSALQTHRRDKFVGDLLINLQEITTTTQSVELFVEAAPEIANEMPLTQRPDTTVDQLLIPLLASTSEASKELLRARSREFSECGRLASAKVRNRLREAFAELLSGPEEDGWSAEVRKLFGD